MSTTGKWDTEPATFARALFAFEPEVCLRRVSGRTTFAWAPSATDVGHGPALIVKRTEGDLARDRWHERLRGRSRSPGRREHENLEALRAEGILVPRPISWCEERAPSGAVRRSLVVMELVEHAETVRDRLAGATGEERARWAAAVLDFVVRLHARGWYHRDLYLQHFVLRVRAGEEELVLLDVGRARRGRAPRARWFVKDLAALAHSAPKTVRARERLRFLARYLDRRGVAGRERRRRWARAIAAKAQRIAAHVPRHGDPIAFRAETES